jgi:hypothetical protein
MKNTLKVILAFAIIGALIYFTIHSKISFAEAKDNLKINNLPQNGQTFTAPQIGDSSEFVVFLKSFFGLQRENEETNDQLALQPQTRGYFADITGDGQKDWLYWQYSPGASGWSNHYKIYQFTGLIPKKVFDFEGSEDYTEFYQQEIISRSLYLGNSADNASINQYREIVFQWNGTEFAKVSDEIKNFSTEQ